jgi:CDGSH-type Zn-finger protein
MVAERARRVVVTDDGPVLIYGPVDVELPDGTRVRSERAVTALCVCGRSRRSPFCDTSHRRRVRGAGTDREENS